MKRIFSKKSGFTLIEIVVAFAIFAIMSTMILSMIRLTVDENKSNNEFADSIEEQTNYLAYHYIADSEKYDPNETEDGAFQLIFNNSAGTLVSDISMKYAMRSSVTLDEEGNANTNMGEGINYFVGNVDYADASNVQNNNGQNEGDTISGLGNSQAARYDTRIMGSKNIDEICIDNVVKDTTYSVPGKTRYFIECHASGNSLLNVASEDAPYLQYKLRFCDTSYQEMEGVDKNGDKYMYKVYNDAQILECGYVTSNDLVWSDACKDYRDTSITIGDNKNYKYTVEPTGNGTIRIGLPTSNTSGFTSGEHTRFYVVFSGDPQLTVNSFGDNGNGGDYTAYPIYDENNNETGDYNLNIYGAFPYEKLEKVVE